MKCGKRSCDGTYKLVKETWGTVLHCVVEYDPDGEPYTIDRPVASVHVVYRCDKCGDEFEDGAP